jgi:CheY-like chemotaxis protein
MSGGRLLLVDDSPTVRKLVELSFARTDWLLDCASTGAQALAAVAVQPPDVLLLDYMLPDMKGVEVCERLARDPALGRIPFVVMSGKGTAVADLFRRFEGFASCIPKPSTSAQIREAIVAASTARGAPSRQVEVAVTRETREATAKALYAVLREGLLQIPRWMQDLGDAPPAPFFARKLLTADVVGKLLSVASTVSARHRESLRPAPEVAEASLQGQLRGWPVAGLITFLEASARSGELTLEVEGHETICYLRAGEVLLVTSRDPTFYLKGTSPAAARLSGVRREALRAAEEEQRASGTPLFVTLAAEGHFPARELTEVLRALGRKLLLAAVDAKSVRFAFRDLPNLPSYVDAHGRHVSFTRNTLAQHLEAGHSPGSLSSEQLALIKLRERGPRELPAEEQVLTRAHGFSARVAAFDLTALERRVLAAVDGGSTTAELSRRLGLELLELRAVLGRMSEIGLLRSVTPTPPVSKRRALMILEEDIEEFQAPLASLLERRAEPIRLIDLSREQDRLSAVVREMPRAVMLNASSDTSRELAVRVRQNTELAGVRLVALVEPGMSTVVPELLRSGFDSALVKPVAYADVERLLD